VKLYFRSTNWLKRAQFRFFFKKKVLLLGARALGQRGRRRVCGMYGAGQRGNWRGLDFFFEPWSMLPRGMFCECMSLSHTLTHTGTHTLSLSLSLSLSHTHTHFRGGTFVRNLVAARQRRMLKVYLYLCLNVSMHTHTHTHTHTWY
jgi:hypothetical protein